MKGKIFLPLLIMAATASAEPARCMEIKKDFHESFKVENGCTLRLKHGDGEVTIRKWDKEMIDIEIHYLAEYKSIGSGKRDFNVEFEQKNNIVEVTGREKSSTAIGFQIFNVKEYTYTVHAPDYIALDLTGEDGSVDIDEWKGNIEMDMSDGDITLTDSRVAVTKIRSEDGDVDVENHEGNLDITVEDGSLNILGSRMPGCVVRNEDGIVSVRDSEGDFDIEISDGNIDLYRVKAGSIDILAEDGDVDIELINTSAIDMDIRTLDGDVEVRLEEGVSAVFTIDADEGMIRTDLPSAGNIQKGKHWLSGKLLDGKGNIRIRTEDGNVTVRQIR